MCDCQWQMEVRINCSDYLLSLSTILHKCSSQKQISYYDMHYLGMGANFPWKGCYDCPKCTALYSVTSHSSLPDQMCPAGPGAGMWMMLYSFTPFTIAHY